MTKISVNVFYMDRYAKGAMHMVTSSSDLPLRGQRSKV